MAIKQPDTLKWYELDEFTRAYCEAALWSTLNWADYPEDANPESFQHDGYGIEDIAQDTLADMAQECAAFQDDNVIALDFAYLNDWYSPERAGCDFWLTRERHGAGFWDRGLPDGLGDELSQKAHEYHGYDLYSHEGQVHH